MIVKKVAEFAIKQNFFLCRNTQKLTEKSAYAERRKKKTNTQRAHKLIKLQ